VQKRNNPYTPGAGRKPRTLAGREADVEEFQGLVERLDAGSFERSLVFTGLRGVGKTVLLMELDALATEAGWATSDVAEVGSQPDFRTTFARMAARLLTNMSRRHRARHLLDRALSVVKAFSVALPGRAVELRLDVEAARGVADSGDPEQDLVELLTEIGQVAQANHVGALFLIDEMQHLDASSLAAICIAFQAVSRGALPVAMVASGLPDLRRRLWAAKPYADRLFAYRSLGSLPPAAARAALIGPAAAFDVRFDEAAAAQVVDEASGYPYFLQEYGLELWNYAESSPITMADVNAVRPLVNDSLAVSFFDTRLELASDSEQRYLSAMASLGGGPYPVAKVAEAFGTADQRRVSAQRDGLITKGTHLESPPRPGRLHRCALRPLSARQPPAVEPPVRSALA
jgi:hypothetical protein